MEPYRNSSVTSFLHSVVKLQTEVVYCNMHTYMPGGVAPRIPNIGTKQRWIGARSGRSTTGEMTG
jgi:hypothetical protein